MIKTILILSFALSALYASAQQPNVILVMTDDQGYGDISAHGNPVLKTPEIDKLYEQSVRFTDFHVAPMCTPTRGQLMTGQDAMRNGATAVCQGRSMVRHEVKLMPQYFAENGYATGLFGKWHLGDSSSHQPWSRGFQEVVSFRAWGFTSLADYWGNTYFDPVLMHNGEDKKYHGYCTDIFFDEAIKFMGKCKSANKPFFVYLPTNTPHVPEVVAENYSKPYQGEYESKKIPSDFYGMIANIDENIGKLEEFLKKSDLRDNTILVFLSDNGTQNRYAQAVYNAGMRARKTSVYEGGHRVHLYVRWIDGKLQHGTDINELTQVQDILPTLLDFCDIYSKEKMDGKNLSELLTGKEKKLDDRMCVVQYKVSGEKWDPAVVMWNKWRLVNGTELYNVADDPGQKNNIIKDKSKVAKKMANYYDRWYKKAKVDFDKKRYIRIGANEAESVTLYASDWQGGYCDNSRGLKQAKTNGYWDIDVVEAGQYEIELRRWSEESCKMLTDSFDDISEVGAIPVAKANLQVGDFDKTVDTQSQDTMARFQVSLKKGKTQLSTALLDKADREICGAMYVKITRK